MSRTVPIDALLKAMSRAEADWKQEEELESERPLSLDELGKLRRGDKVTVVETFRSGARRVSRCKVTTNQPYGYTDLRGFWCFEPEAREGAIPILQILAGRTPGEVVPTRKLTFKEAGSDYSIRMVYTGTASPVVYRGWKVNP